MADDEELRIGAVRVLRRAIMLVEGYADTLLWARNDYEDNIRGRVLGPIAEWRGGVRLPPASRFEGVVTFAEIARNNLEATLEPDSYVSIEEVEQFLQLAERSYNDAAREWSEFMEAVDAGSSQVIGELKLTRDTSFTILAAVATKGVGTGVATKAAASAGAQTAATTVSEATTRLTEMHVGLRSEFDGGDFLLTVTKAGVSSLAKSLTTGALGHIGRSVLARNVTLPLGSAIYRNLGPAAASVQGVLSNAAEDALFGAGGSVAQHVVEAALDAMVERLSNDELDALERDEQAFAAVMGQFVGELVQSVADDLVADLTGKIMGEAGELALPLTDVERILVEKTAGALTKL